MIYNTLALADATLAMINFLYTEDNADLVLESYRGEDEYGYKLINHKEEQTVSFCQSASGDDLVIYPSGEWEGVYFNCDDLFNAAKYIMERLENNNG